VLGVFENIFGFVCQCQTLEGADTCGGRALNLYMCTRSIKTIPFIFHLSPHFFCFAVSSSLRSFIQSASIQLPPPLDRLTDCRMLPHVVPFLVGFMHVWPTRSSQR